MRFNPNNAECLIFTFKEGMLSAVAHDLKIRVEHFEIDVEGLETGAVSKIEGHFDTESLRVVCARKNGEDLPRALSDGDRKKIEQNILEDVLPPKRAKKATFRSTKVDGNRIEGTLSLNGVERPLRFEAKRTASHTTVDIEIHQPDFEIKPYTAALGTLRVNPTLQVHVVLPIAQKLFQESTLYQRDSILPPKQILFVDHPSRCAKDPCSQSLLRRCLERVLDIYILGAR